MKAETSSSMTAFEIDTSPFPGNSLGFAGSVAALIPPGPYAIEPRSGMQLWGALRSVSISLHLHEWQVAQEGQPAPSGLALCAAPASAVDAQQTRSQNKNQTKYKPYAMSGSVAVISLVGPMSKNGGRSLSSGASTVDLRRQVRLAAADPDVTAMLLRIDSPGGQIAGTPDLAADVRQAALKKPFYAYAEDMCCSAAYWVASQCNAIYANASAFVGSIGVLLVITDSSEAAQQAGEKVIVVSTGDFKGVGAEGTEITEEQVAYIQGQVDDIGAQFISAVNRGRGLSLTLGQAPADGAVYFGAKARSVGLVDGITPLDSVLSKLRNYKAA
jgi:signal peptide peptidase SppA